MSTEVKDKASKLDKSTKRKRDSDAAAEELEIDIHAPEPPSKKAKRKEKKLRKDSATSKTGDAALASPTAQHPSVPAAQKKNERSDHGVWIGNLSFTTTKDDVRAFLRDQGDIAETHVTRVHMPAPSDGKSKNKGFAYVDFTSAAMLDKALSLSEKLLAGRKLLIKNAKSFEGRPEKAKVNTDAPPDKEPTKRVFVGNLGFDVTREELAEHYARAGEVEDVFLATFEDSGKCKGFGWVRFTEVEAAQAAVMGFVKVKDDEANGEESDGEPDAVAETDGQKKGKKKRQANTKKIFVNRLNGRPLRCEFAEDAQTRYKKRYGKDKEANTNGARNAQAPRPADAPAIAEVDETAGRPKARPKRKGTADERRDERRRVHDARKIAPGQSLANAPRASAAIVAGSGKKISFD